MQDDDIAFAGCPAVQVPGGHEGHPGQGYATYAPCTGLSVFDTGDCPFGHEVDVGLFFALLVQEGAFAERGTDMEMLSGPADVPILQPAVLLPVMQKKPETRVVLAQV